MAVVLSDVLDEQNVTLGLAARTRDEALREIVWTMTGDGKISDPEKFLSEVLAREEVHTTFMGNGVAFPHSRTELIEQIVLGIGRSDDGIPFGEQGELAHLLFVVAVPHRMINDYLICVGALARITHDPANRQLLMKASTPAEFLEVLRAGWLLLE